MRAQPASARAIWPSDQVVRHRGQHARHVRGVLPHRQKAAGVGGARNKAERDAQPHLLWAVR